MRRLGKNTYTGRGRRQIETNIKMKKFDLG